MYRLEKITSFCVYYKMDVITAEAYKNAGVHIIIVENEELFWVKMNDVQNGLGVRRISAITKKEIRGIIENRNPTREQKKKIIKSGQEINKELEKSRFRYARNNIMEKIIKNCRGVKKFNDDMDRKDK